MAMSVGQAQADPVTGMAGMIYNSIVSSLQAQTINGTPLCPTPIPANARKVYAALAEGIATGVYTSITTTALVNLSTGAIT